MFRVLKVEGVEGSWVDMPLAFFWRGGGCGVLLTAASEVQGTSCMGWGSKAPELTKGFKVIAFGAFGASRGSSFFLGSD